MLHFQELELTQAEKKADTSPFSTVLEKRYALLGDLTQVKFEVKIADFGVSRELEHGRLADTPEGTRLVIAPEALRERFDHRVDVWGVGIIAYMLLTKQLIFKTNSQHANGIWEISTEIPYSIEFLRFVNETVLYDPSIRPFPD